jgi:hypothetical protein
MEAIVGGLRDAGAVKGEIVACDATFIKAYSKRDQRMIRGVTAIQTLGLEGLGRVIGSATSST